MFVFFVSLLGERKVPKQKRDTKTFQKALNVREIPAVTIDELPGICGIIGNDEVPSLDRILTNFRYALEPTAIPRIAQIFRPRPFGFENGL